MNSMFNSSLIKNVLCFDLNSSIYTYLKYRQFVLFVYILILLIFFFIYSVIFCYYYDSFFSFNYTCSNYLNVGLRNLVNNIFIFLNYVFFDHYLFFKDGFDPNSLDDRFFLYNVYRSSLDLPSSYSLTLELSGWKDWCGPCGYRGTVPDVHYKDGSIPIIFRNDLDLDLDYGSFFNYNMQLVEDSNRLFMQSPQMNVFFDSKAIKSGLLYTDSIRLMQNYLNVNMLKDFRLSGLYDFRDVLTIDSYNYENLFSEFESKKILKFFPINTKECYINAGVEKLSGNWSISDCLGSYSSDTLVPCASFYIDKSINDYVARSSDEVTNSFLIKDYILRFVLNCYNVVIDHLYNDSNLNIDSGQEFVDLNKSKGEQKNMIEDHHKFVKSCFKFYDNIQNYLGINSSKWDFSFKGNKLFTDELKRQTGLNVFNSVSYQSPVRFLEIDPSVVHDSLSSYFAEYLNNWTNFMDSAWHRTIDAIKYSYLHPTYGIESGMRNESNSDLFLIKDLYNSVYKSFCPDSPSVSNFTSYRRSMSDSSFEYSKLADYNLVYVYEFDVSSRLVQPLNMNIDRLFSYFELNKDIDSENIRHEHNFGLHNLYFFENSGLGISIYDFTDVKKYILEGYFRSDIYTLFSHMYGISNMLSLKILALVYPFLLILICTFLFFHIVYAYEFLLNDYVECVQIKVLLSFAFFISAFLFFYLYFFSMFLTDFYSVDISYFKDKIISDSHNMKKLGTYNVLFNSEESFMDMYLNMYNLEYNIPFESFFYKGNLFLVLGSTGASFHYWRKAMRVGLITLVFVTIGNSLQKGFVSFIFNVIKRTFFTTFPYKAEYIYDDEVRVVGYKESDGQIHLYDRDNKLRRGE